MSIVPQPRVKLYLNGNYRIKEGPITTAVGKVTHDTGLRQLNAFLTAFTATLKETDQQRTLCDILVPILKELASTIDSLSTDKIQQLLVLKIDSELDPKANTLNYKFTLQTEPKDAATTTAATIGQSKE